MTTLRKNLFKQPFFWTSVCSFLALGILISLYSYAWVSPTASPNSNAGSAINFSGGNVGVGTVSPSSKLDVVGNIGIRTGNGLRLYNPANADYATVSLDGVNVVQANYPWNFSGTGDHTISGSVGIGVADPVEKLEVAGNIKMTGTGNGIKFPDGTSQTTAASSGSDGSVTTTWSTYKHYFTSTSTYNGNLGGLSGCDAKCNSDAKKISGKTYHCTQTVNNVWGTDTVVFYNAISGSMYDSIKCWAGACKFIYTANHPAPDDTKSYILYINASMMTDIKYYNYASLNQQIPALVQIPQYWDTSASSAAYCTNWTNSGSGYTGYAQYASTYLGHGGGQFAAACNLYKNILCLEN